MSLFTLLIAAVAALHAWIAWRLAPPLTAFGPAGTVGAIVVAAAVAASAFAILGGFAAFGARRGDGGQAERERRARRLRAGYMALAAFSNVATLTLVRDAALLAAWLAGAGSAGLDAWSAVAAIAAAAVATAVGRHEALRVPRVRSFDVAIDGLDPALDGYTVVQLSDIHVGDAIGATHVARIVERVNALAPDLVAITGDVVDGSVAERRDGVAPLGELRARDGVMLVIGNHELYSGLAPWVAEFRRIGLDVLLNAHRTVAGGRLVVGGVTDASTGAWQPALAPDAARAFAASAPGARRLLLAHQPRTAFDAAAAGVGFDMALSGHTHGGQFWPWVPFVRLQQPVVRGWHRVPGAERDGRAGRLYVHAGTGFWGPANRFGVPSEIARLTLRVAAPESATSAASTSAAENPAR